VTVDKIFLVGFMAAGKTTVARIVANRLGWGVEDIDTLIEARERRPIADIFRLQGEPYFRAVEREIVQLVLPLRQVVVATGCGTFVDPENRAAMARDGLCVWIDVPLDELVARLPSDGRRPLAADRAQMERLYGARQLAYAHAHLRIDGRGLTSGEVADRILDGVRTFERHPL
jgi:shikimate kinase